MNISDCLDSIQNGSGATNSSTLSAKEVDEIELIQSIAKLLYRTKSVRKCIEILDIISNSEVFHSDDCGSEIVLNEISEYKCNQIWLSKHEQIPYSGC